MSNEVFWVADLFSSLFDSHFKLALPTNSVISQEHKNNRINIPDKCVIGWSDAL